MLRQISGAALGLVIAIASLLSASATAALAAPYESPTSAPAEAQGMVVHGCVVTVGDDYLVIRTGGAGVGDGRTMHVKTTLIPNYDPATTADGCGAIVAYQEDGVWYAASISVTRNEQGEVTTNQNSGSRPVGPRQR